MTLGRALALSLMQLANQIVIILLPQNFFTKYPSLNFIWFLRKTSLHHFDVVHIFINLFKTLRSRTMRKDNNRSYKHAWNNQVDQLRRRTGFTWLQQAQTFFHEAPCLNQECVQDTVALSDTFNSAKKKGGVVKVPQFEEGSHSRLSHIQGAK